MALDCHFAEALCLGIGEYQHEQCLPKAATDAESMAVAFRDLGCCNTMIETNKEHLTRQRAVELVSDFVLRTKRRMQEAETVRPEPAGKPLLVALFVAAHGIHAHGKELPLIVPADLMCNSETEQLVDLDQLFLNELSQVTLPKINRHTCCIWIIMDTCRSGQLTSWQCPLDCEAGERKAGYRGPLPLKTKLTPEFLFLLACDPGGWASDSDSLTSVLVKSLQQDGVSIRDACEHAIGVVQHALRGRQRPWMNQRAGPIFSQIRKLSPTLIRPVESDDVEVECVPQWVQVALARLAGFTAALLVLICFFGLFFCFKIAGAEKIARGDTCPSNSCFCTDCHHRNIYSNDHRDPAHFNCKLWDEGPTLNRCQIAQFLHVLKIGFALAISRKSWSRLLGFVVRDGATPLDLCVVLVAVVNVLTSLPLPLQDPVHVTLVANLYGILNFAFITASISILMLIHVEFPGVQQWSGGPILSNFTGFFLATAMIGQGLILVWSRAMGLISAEHAGKQEMLFYAFHVFTGAVLAGVGFAMSSGNEGAVAQKSGQLLCLSLCWMFVVLAWLFTSHYNEDLMAKYHLLRVVAERACNCWKIRLMVWFSEHSIRCLLLRGGFVGTVPWGMRAARVVQADSSQPERAQTTWDAASLLPDEFHVL